MTGAIQRKTNADVVQPFVDRAKVAAREGAAYFREHPDELAVGLAPFLMLWMATKRHHLNFAEAALVSEVAVWGGVFAARAYQDWKAKPAEPALMSVNRPRRVK